MPDHQPDSRSLNFAGDVDEQGCPLPMTVEVLRARTEKWPRSPQTPDAVATIVKNRADAAGYDEKTFAGHSLRAGFATEAFGKGVPELSVMRHGRWRSSTSMRGYIREGDLWRDNAAAKLGL